MLSLFGQNVGATGFGLNVERLLEVRHFDTDALQSVAILFDEANFEQAMQQATQLRSQGKAVTLQFIRALQDVAQFTQHFDETLILAQEDQA